MKLKDAPIGLFMHGDVLALKTEYIVNDAVEAYTVVGGERFWGGVNTAEAVNNLEVTPVDLNNFTPQSGQAMPNWINAKERQPEKWRKEDEEMINYLIYSPQFGVDIGNYLKPAKTWLCVGIPCAVTHWAEMPAPPKEG